LKLPKPASVLQSARTIYRKHKSRFDVENPWDGLFGSMKEFDKPNRQFESSGIVKATASFDAWIRSHIRHLAVGDDKRSIDPSFSGIVETKHPNGAVKETLEVKKGKANGAYSEFFDDGTVRQSCFYKSGKISGDCWPSGQLKRKESKRGKHKVIEWYYPSGALQKRLVLHHTGYLAEPARLFHENGQLAEVLTVVEGKKQGRWVKFFEDESPQLEAEYRGDRELIVHNAWDSNRRQVVKAGTGVFEDDGRDVDWQYDLFHDSDWQHKCELKDGIRHGKTTTYFMGVLSSVEIYKRGKRDGESIRYWDNGRVRKISRYRNGKEGKAEEFPKFDNPVPAVLLEVEANENLYTRWRHIPVDEYPAVLNLEQIRVKLQPPRFLMDIHARNVAGQLEDRCEDWNDFNDGITYFLKVDASGDVVDVQTRGSGVHSGNDWNTYVPFLKQLRFKPGHIKGRPVECRVLVRVTHTFIEGTKT
jgi:antitoxin component YwqK of YwqJK toxin-antitoxin module